MKEKIIFILALALTAGSMGLKAQDVTFKAIAPEAVAMGQQFRLTYTVNAQGTELRIPDLNDFDVLMGPSTSTNTSIQFINGQQSSVVTQSFTYILMPKKEGSFNVAPATIKVRNANYTSNALVIKVLPPDKSGNAGRQGGGDGSQPATSSTGISNDDLFVRVSLSSRNVYEQEGFLVTFKIYSLVDVGVSNIKFPEFEGFLAQEIDVTPQWTLENYNGRNYRTAVIKQTYLYPQRSGKITIESGKFDALVRVRVQRQARSIFDPFLESYQDVKKELTTTPVTIEVKPLPPGKPASFSGAVGNYTMKTAINSQNVKTNEAVTVTVTLSGNGNLKIAKNPEVVFPNDFEVYDPKVDTKLKTTAAGTSGSKTVEYMAIPRFAGDFEIPPVAFSWFDTKSGTYKTVTSDAFKLHVEKGAGGENTGSPVVSNFTNRENVRRFGEDIRYLKLGSVRFLPNRELFFGSMTCILVYVTVIVLFVAFFVIYRKQMKENANIALVRTRKANKTAVRRLKQAEKLLKEHKKEAFYDEVLRAVWGYLSDKLSIPLAHLTKDNVEAELAKYGVEETLSEEFMELLNTCEFARYAPSQASDAMDILFKQTVNAIGRMESIIKK
ncbi:MAG: BatD family protein [Tannerella sp.]|jgi:hypothetical protein|nr:BatD family protein [Tannerella sp.]